MICNDIYDMYVESVKQKLTDRLQNRINKKRSKYNIEKAKFDFCICLVSKIYGVSQDVLKNRNKAHEKNAINKNYREASGMLYFILINKFNWSWEDIITNFKTNKFSIHKYINKFQETKDKETQDKYFYIIDKIDKF